MRYTQSNTEISNSQTISDGVVLDGTNIQLTNTGSGRIVGGVQFAQAGNTLINQTGAFVRGADGAPATAASVVGSSGSDTIVNSGSITGAINLGAGSDTFVQRNGANADLNLGADNDLLRFEAGGSNFAANGGAGYDTVVLASGFSPTQGTDIVGFERLVVESDIVVTDYSGYQAIEFANPGATIYVSDSQNPLVDLRLANQGVDLSNQSTLRSVTGGDSNETVGLASGSVVSGPISLGGGSDRFNLLYRPDYPDASFSTVDGGAGFDRVLMGLRGPIVRQLDFSGVSNFDQLDIYTQDALSTVTLTGLSGLQRIDLDGAINLTLADSNLSGAVFSISLDKNEASAPQGITLAGGTVIGSFTAQSYEDANSEYLTAGAASATTLVNSARIEGDVYFNIGNDRYDGRSGIVGGTVYGNAGNDVLLGGSGSDALFGGVGDDMLTGGYGNDRLTGGEGYDEAIFGGRLSQYSVGTFGGLTLSGVDGADTVYGIERLRFADGVVSLQSNAAGIDNLYYLQQNADVYAAGIDPADHYRRSGAAEGRDPNGYFSTRGYLAANPDVAAAGVNPLDHYLTVGAREGRDPSARFDTELYLLYNPDVASSGVNPLEHYLSAGRYEGRQAYSALGDNVNARGFDEDYYRLANPDVAASGMNAFDHYNLFGASEGRDPNGWFDTSYYLDHNPDVAAAGLNALEHYDRIGWREGRDPSAIFDTSAYLEANADVRAAGLDPLVHFLQFGAEELREAIPVIG